MDRTLEGAEFLLKGRQGFTEPFDKLRANGKINKEQKLYSCGGLSKHSSGYGKCWIPALRVIAPALWVAAVTNDGGE